MFYLQDLGSKMGTYLRIIKNIVIEEGTCIQFSTDIEIVFRILKKVYNMSM
jgi:pSer/pThr/pTyr-binding forkhead associated (FHA) protein